MTERTTISYLPDGLPIPVADPDGLSAPYWEGLKEGRIRVQRCSACSDLAMGTRVDLPSLPCAGYGLGRCRRRGHDLQLGARLASRASGAQGAGPYLVVLVELPQAGGIRMIGNLLGDPLQVVSIGAEVVAAFEHHPEAKPPFSLLQWRVSGGRSRQGVGRDRQDPDAAPRPYSTLMLRSRTILPQ